MSGTLLAPLCSTVPDHRRFNSKISSFTREIERISLTACDISRKMTILKSLISKKLSTKRGYTKKWQLRVEQWSLGQAPRRPVACRLSTDVSDGKVFSGFRRFKKSRINPVRISRKWPGQGRTKKYPRLWLPEPESKMLCMRMYVRVCTCKYVYVESRSRAQFWLDFFETW